MGIVDEKFWSLICEPCGIVERLKALDKGSRHVGSHWVGPDDPVHFSATIGDGKYSPEVTNVACKKCGKAAKVVSGW
jgi:hypothetical protein